MVEALPVIKENKLLLISSCMDITKVISYDEGITKWFLWVEDFAYNVSSEICNGIYYVDDSTLFFNKWFGEYPWIFCRLIDNLDEYVDFLHGIIGKQLEGKNLVLSFSGGKDSTAILLILLKLMEKINFRLRAIYVHMPYLEPEYNIRFIERLAKRLSVDITITSPPKSIIRKYLFEEGLPYRRERWCTYLKVKPIKDYIRKSNVDVHAIGDRVWEASKRHEKLSAKLLKGKFIEGRKFYPIAPLTLIDVITIAKENKIIHPDYLMGATRVSCYYCPYKSIFELKLLRPQIEDPGLIDEVLKREWKRWYKKICFENFKKYHLWRYVPTIAKLLHKAKDRLKNEDSKEKMTLGEIKKYNTYIWLNNIEVPKLRYENILNIIK